MSFSGLEGGTLAAVLGSNTQAMSTFLAAYNLVRGLTASKATPAAAATSVVNSAYFAFSNSNSSTAASKASAVLTDKAQVAVLFRAAYTSCVAPVDQGAKRRLHADAYIPADKLDAVFGAAAEVGGRCSSRACNWVSASLFSGTSIAGHS